MWVNNEFGILINIVVIGEWVCECGVLFYVDVVQVSGKVVIDLGCLVVDLMLFFVYKIYGFKGIGVLYVGLCVECWLKVQIYGGGYEQGLCFGILVIYQIVGMGEVFVFVGEFFEEEGRCIVGFQWCLLEGLVQIDGWCLNGSVDVCIVYILNLIFDNLVFVFQVLEFSLVVFSILVCNLVWLVLFYVFFVFGYDVVSVGCSVCLSFGCYICEVDVDVVVVVFKVVVDSGVLVWQLFFGVFRVG